MPEELLQLQAEERQSAVAKLVSTPAIVAIVAKGCNHTARKNISQLKKQLGEYIYC